jgi:hypothetical protein
VTSRKAVWPTVPTHLLVIILVLFVEEAIELSRKKEFHIVVHLEEEHDSIREY